VNFGTILNSVTKECVTMMVESKEVESKVLARNFINYVQMKESLSLQFRIYHQLNSSFIKDVESAKLFVTETLAVLDGHEFDDIKTYNHLIELKCSVPLLKSTDIDMHISKLIRYKTIHENKNQIEFIESFQAVVEHISAIRDEINPFKNLNETISNSTLKVLQPKHIVRIALKKFNNKFTSKFDMEDKIMFNTLREGSEQNIFALYKKTIMALKLESERLTLNDNIDLSNKILEAINRVGKKYTQENLLDAHELHSELKKLNEGKS